MPLDFGDLDFSDVERSTFIDFAGEAVCIITDAETSPSKDGNSTNLWLSIVVEEPAEHEGKGKNRILINITPPGIDASGKPTKGNLFIIRNFLEKLLGVEINGSISEYMNSEKELIGQKIGASFRKEDKYYNVDEWFHVSQ